jgi:hypothetical protein
MQADAVKEESYRDWLQLSVSLICAAFRRIKDPEWTSECDEFMPHL